MIKEFINAWNLNNKKLLDKYKKAPPNSYEDIVKDIISVVLNPYLVENHNLSSNLNNGLDVNNITIIDDGDYQGTQIYLIHVDLYQPDVSDYVYTHNYYGSCSGCDTFEDIQSRMQYDGHEKYISDENSAKEFHELALHLLQRFKYLNQ